MFTILYSTPWLVWSEVPTTLLILTLILSLILFLCTIFKSQNDSKTALLAEKLQEHNIKQMPSPPTIPILGHIHLLRDHQHNPWDGFDEIRKQFGDVVSLKMGVHPMVLVSDCATMREILLKKGAIFSNRPNFARHHIIFGGDKENSLALCDWSNIHRDRRKFCKKAIVPNRLSARNQFLEEIISELVVKFVDNISAQEPNRAISNPLYSNTNGTTNNLTILSLDNDVPSNGSKTVHCKLTKKDLLFLTSDIFLRFLCNEERSHDAEAYREFVYGCDFVFWDINQSYLMDFLPFLTSLGLGFSYLKKLKQVTDFLRNYIDDEIFDPRLQKLTKIIENNLEIIGDNGLEGGDDYLNSLICEHLSNVTSMSLADYKVGFADLLAGHAAVANILTRLLGHLALCEKIQDMISEEAEKADIQNSKCRPSLPMTEAALHEALRLASSPIVPHVAREDTSIDQFYVPTGTMVLFNIHHLNLSEDLWVKPYEFDPTRFLNICDNDSGEKTYKLNLPKHFMPFSVGMRQCLGHKMVETTTILTVANLCRKFRIKPNDEKLVERLLTPKGSVALNPDAECFEFKLYPRH